MASQVQAGQAHGPDVYVPGSCSKRALEVQAAAVDDHTSEAETEGWTGYVTQHPCTLAPLAAMERIAASR